MRSILGSTATILGFCLASALSTAVEPAPSAGNLPDLAERLVRAYFAGDVEALRPHLAPGLVFRDPGLEQRFDLSGFLDLVSKMGTGESDRELEFAWVGIADDFADVRGTWRWTDAENGRRREMRFSIELELETAGKEPQVISWLDDFRRRAMWKPAAGDGRLETEHFRVVYLETEFSAEEADRLGETLEHWYEKTRLYLGRSFAEGHRLQVNVAGGHESPYASDPGPEAFILVPTRWAKREYGFSLVHELTHNLLGLSWLSRHELERNGVELHSGNRLFDEGFAVYVEEKLTGEGPRVWPNFGEETHAAYRTAREQQGEPIWPVLEAEIHREHGDTRLAYLAQASFCKFLVETHGLDRFLRLFVTDPASAKEIYGKDLAGLEQDWRTFLETQFASRLPSDSSE
jgi:hypothetical protein